MMTRIVIHWRVGPDGVLQLAVPMGVDEANLEFEVTIEPAALELDYYIEQQEWRQFVRETAGAWQGDFVRLE
jgi:hypothetical protein